MKILVRNLERGVSEAELSGMFKPFGTVESCDLVLDKATGRSKGFGFVEMPDEKGAKQAVQTLNGKTIRGVKMRVKRTLRGVPPRRPKRS